jgi:hypothetical protein
MSDPVKAVTGKWYEPIDTEKFWGDLAPAPSKREWVGLTDEETIDLLPVGDWEIESTLDFAKAIEAKLKEKNT